MTTKEQSRVGQAKGSAVESAYVGTAWITKHAGISRATLNRLRAKKLLPPHVTLGPRLHRWRRSDVEKWLADLIGKGRPDA